jgi:hypothetical protein
MFVAVYLIILPKFSLVISLEAIDLDYAFLALGSNLSTQKLFIVLSGFIGDERVTVRQKKIAQLEFITGLVGGMMLIVYWLIIATLPDFFFINPTGEASQIRRLSLVLSTVGWLAMSTGAPVALFFYSAGYHKARKFLPYTALIWPISLVISQITVYVLDGNFYLDYLLKFPIFLYTDLVLPIFILFIWHDLRESGVEEIESDKK